MRLRLLPVLAVAALLAGCGGSSGPKSNGEATKTSSQILADAQAAVTGATSVHVFGAGESGGTKLNLNLHLVAGKGGDGTVTIDGLTFNIVRIGDTAYFSGGSAFWRHFGGAAAAALLKGRWLKAPASSGQLASFTPLTDVNKLFDQILGSHGKLEVLAVTTVAGQSAVPVKDTTKGGTLYVAATGTPYPLELSKPGAGGAISFDSWNAAVSLTAPKNAIDYTKLAG